MTAIPTGLVATNVGIGTDDKGIATLSWTNNELNLNAQAPYQIEIATVEGVWIPLRDINVDAFPDQDIIPNSLFYPLAGVLVGTTVEVVGLEVGYDTYLAVRARDVNGVLSERSIPVVVRPLRDPTAVPSMRLVPGDSQLTVFWTPNPFDQGVATYDIYVRESLGTGEFPVTPAFSGLGTAVDIESFATITGLKNGVAYTTRLIPRQASGLVGPATDRVSVPQPISPVAAPVSTVEDIDELSLLEFRTASLNEEFADNLGRLLRYHPYNANDRSVLLGQKHIDVRSFVGESRLVRLEISDFSKYTMDDLDGMTMTEIQGSQTALIPSEAWTLGVIDTDPMRKNWSRLSVPIVAGTNSSASIIRVGQSILALDIETGFDDDDFISVALPDFPLNSINIAASRLEFTSNEHGDFTVGPSSAVSFASSIFPLTVGDSEFRVNRRLFRLVNPNLDFTRITAVRFVIEGTATAIFRAMAIRLLGKHWRYGQTDVNTYYKELQASVAPNADPTRTYDYVPPIMWRSAAGLSGFDDPRPVDGRVGAVIHTGSLQRDNELSLYFREVTEDYMTQLDLNGTSMLSLNGNNQPDTGTTSYDIRPQSDLNNIPQFDLDGDTQFELERTPDSLLASWIQFSCRWNSQDTIFSISNTERGGYSFNLGSSLTPGTDYIIMTEIEDDGVRMRIYPLSGFGEILTNDIIFDSTLIKDDYSFKRRKGRFGWFANLEDGDAAIKGIRERGVTYAEYRSLPMPSLTPVDGVELVAENTSHMELFTEFQPTSNEIVLSSRIEGAREIFEAQNPKGAISQGLRSNQFIISDFEQTEATLDLLYTGTSEGLNFVLVSSTGTRLNLTRPLLTPNLWQSIRLRMPFTYEAQTGPYRLVIEQNENVPTSISLDHVKIFRRAVSWYGRSGANDPWDTRDTWVPFKNAVNTPGSGIMFPSRGRSLQVRGLGHFESAKIERVQFKPRYATLGRFAWPEDRLFGAIPPVASFTISNVGRTYQLKSTSSDPDGEVVNWYWNISDGSQHFGPVVSHTFTAPGTYGISLTVTDRNGLVHTTTATQSVA